MTAFKDHFSGHASDYTRYRPSWQAGLFAHLAGMCLNHRHAWDCGTGGGQAALLLTPYFERVSATDASANQVAQAPPHPSITYGVASAEESGLANASVDLINVCQAAHWFSFDAFFQEVRRIAAPGCLLALSGYGLFELAPEIDTIVADVYQDIMPWWPPERSHIEAAYASLPFPFEEIAMPAFYMEAHWNLDHLIGYLGTWSAVRRCITETGKDPVAPVAAKLASLWGAAPSHERLVRWPLFFRVAKVS